MALLRIEKVAFPKLKSTFLAALIPMAVGLNFAGYAIRQTLGVPLFLDAGGTILVSLITGPWYGCLVAIMTAIVKAIAMNPMQLFSPGGLVCALVVGFAARWGITRTWPGLLLTLVVMVPLMSVASALVSTYIYGGFTGSTMDILTAVFIKAGGKIFQGIFLSQMLTSYVDKAVLLVIDSAILKALPPQYQILTPFGKPEETDSMAG